MRRLSLFSFIAAFTAIAPQFALSQINTRGIVTDLRSTSDHFTPLDINGDGKMDMLYSRAGQGYAGVYISHGDGTFRYVAYTNGGSTTSAGFPGDLESTADTFVPLDINGDGKSDFLYFRPGQGYAFECLSLGDGRVNCLPLSTPNGQSNGMLDTFENGNEQIIAADLNGDGKSDFILWTRTTGYARAYLSNGDGTFKAVNYAVGGSPMNGFADSMRNGDENFVAVDLNGDGKSDIVFSSPSHGVVRTFLANSNGSGTLNPPTTLADGSGDHLGFSGNASDGSGRALALDFNGDGKGDFLWYEPGNGFAAVYVSTYPSSGGVAQYLLRQGNSQHGFQGDLSSGADTATILDFNGDGKSDLLFTRPGAGFVTLYVSNGTSANLTAYDYANAGNTALGFVNNADSGNDTAIALNFLGQRNSAFLWYSPGNGITVMNAYTQNPTAALGQLTDYSFHAYPSTYMSDLSWSIANTPLKGIVMPGTHDTAMYVTAIADIATTQDLNWSGQMADGGRAFDLRMAWYDVNNEGVPTRVDHDGSSTCLSFNSLSGSGFWLYGHSDYCANESASDVFSQINNFLSRNSKEILVIDLTAIISGQNGNHVQDFVKLLNTQLGSLIYTQQAACAAAGASTVNNQCLVASVSPQNVTAQTLWNLGRRIIFVDEGSDTQNTGYAWPNSIFTTQGYCDGTGEDTLALELQCMDIGVMSAGGVQSARPEFVPYDAAPTFLNLKAAITPYGYYSYLGDALLISPFYAAYGLFDNDTGFNSYVANALTSQGKWQRNALNLFNMDAIDSQSYVGDLIARNDQSWNRSNFTGSGLSQPAAAIAVGANGDVWAAPAPGGHAIGIFKLNQSTGKWASLIESEPEVQRLAVAPDGGVYVVDSSYAAGSNLGRLLHFDHNGQNKTDTGSIVQDVAVGADGSVWCIGANTSLFRLQGPANALVSSTPQQSGIRVAVNNLGVPYVLDASGVIHRYDPTSSQWIAMPGLPNTTDAVPITNLNSSGIGFHDVSQQVFSIGWKAVNFSLGADGSLLVVGNSTYRSSTIGGSEYPFPGAAYPSNNSTWRYSPSANGWDPLRMDAAQVAVDPGGHPWVIRNGTNLLYKGALDQTN